LAPIWYL